MSRFIHKRGHGCLAFLHGFVKGLPNFRAFVRSKPEIIGEHIAAFKIDLRDKRRHLEAPGTKPEEMRGDSVVRERAGVA